MVFFINRTAEKAKCESILLDSARPQQGPKILNTGSLKTELLGTELLKRTN